MSLVLKHYGGNKVGLKSYLQYFR